MPWNVGVLHTTRSSQALGLKPLQARSERAPRTKHLPKLLIFPWSFFERKARRTVEDNLHLLRSPIDTFRNSNSSEVFRSQTYKRACQNYGLLIFQSYLRAGSTSTRPKTSRRKNQLPTPGIRHINQRAGQEKFFILNLRCT